MSSAPNTPEQDKAIAGVGTAFSTAPSGLTPEQQAAYLGVQKAFTTAPPAPVAPTAPATPAPTATDSTYYPRYSDPAPIAAPAPQSVEEIQAAKAKAAQAEIDALNGYYANLSQEQQTINAKNDRSTSSINTLTGLAGSTEANVQQQKTTDMGSQALKKIENEKAVAINQILSKIRSDAVTEARQQRLDYNQSVTDSIANRAALMKETVDNIKNLSASGVTLEGLRTSDPQSYEHLLKRYDGDANALKGAFVLNTPQDQILDKKIEGGKYVIARQNPITGKITIESTDLGLPAGFSKTVDAGDRILAIPDNWNGDPSKLVTINKGLTPTQQADTGTPGENPQLYSGLSSKTATAVRAKVAAFKTEPIVQNYATVQDGYNFAESIDTKTQNPADDQALIYSLAKALDPGSVVREGEYATAQKYAQSWIAAYGKGVTQALAGTGFLSETARENIKKVIEQKYISTKKSYDNLSGQYKTGINSLTGRDDGSKFLIDYTTPPASRSKTLTKGGQSFDASDLSPEEYQQALDDGYVEQ